MHGLCALGQMEEQWEDTNLTYRWRQELQQGAKKFDLPFSHEQNICLATRF
jgi:hypothetical protein